ncbi:hypothetical protein N7492_001080 [Penicillium capsulatum]|uniref:Vacuolar import and degradation protein-domain-containing protein n=1 Tax=Penicillium capsulatum TaxID=69766 RepID=A0A9W9IQT5_9EURO|nr:hypothetical protein N7492_001080 [Penicillium capsulatum]KAJ6129861.1 hypothetical protein N7512_002641 [Penicillium capsulatum]
MPPPNSATHGTPISPSTPAPESTPPRSHYPDSPVPANDNAHDENVNFLRSRYLHRNPSPTRHRRRRYHTAHPRPMDDEDRMDVEDTSHSRLSVEINRRIPIVRRQRENPANMPSYESQRANPRSLYGWAPASDDEDDDVRRDESEDEQIQPFLHAISDPSTPSNRRRLREPPLRSLPPPMPAAAVAAAGDGEQESTRSLDSRLLSMEMFLQSARFPSSQPRLSRTRALENYLLDRPSNERQSNGSSEEPDETERGGSSSSPRAYRYRPSNRGHAQRILTHSDLRARSAAHRRLHSNSPGESLLKDTITYLDRIRYSSSFTESLNSAAATGFITLDDLSWKDNDFLLNTSTIAPPATCSWLRPGVVYSGYQRAANAGCSVLSQRVSSPHAPSDPVIVNGSDSTRISVYTTNGRQYFANSRDENWPVKVTVHNINYNEMTLSGTMEAYNIPDKTTPNNDAHIVTFLEGEIIDFNKHTLETKNFKADADIDSTYWRELQPFKDLTDSDISKKLVSRKWITEELARGWILMRWKERCFITPTDSRQGLTISGFYYISLRREDGHVEGLYYDPGSSPYQQLSLKPESVKMSCPSYSFR